MCRCSSQSVVSQRVPIWECPAMHFWKPMAVHWACRKRPPRAMQGRFRNSGCTGIIFLPAAVQSAATGPIRWNAFHLISLYCRILTSYRGFTNQKCQLYPSYRGYPNHFWQLYQKVPEDGLPGLSRCVAESNHCNRFCRPVPDHSANAPWFEDCKYRKIFLFSKTKIRNGK